MLERGWGTANCLQSRRSCQFEKGFFKHHLSPAFFWCWGKGSEWQVFKEVSYSPGDWKELEQSKWSGEQGKQVSTVGSWVQAFPPAYWREPDHRRAHALPCDCPCCLIVSRLPGLVRAPASWHLPKQCPWQCSGGSTSQDLFSVGSMDEAALSWKKRV